MNTTLKPGDLVATVSDMTDCYSEPDITTPVFGLHFNTIGLVITLVRKEEKDAGFYIIWAYIMLSKRHTLCWVPASDLCPAQHLEGVSSTKQKKCTCC